MAPSRRRGGSKASSAAAAARKWKVGDLVLAKVKGFPAWPAMVSEPQKWGLSTDWKKVLVYFFGTKQIAFCNPVDVEAFTEEKKASLLTKRQGKGADFVRAVEEIIDSYEKSKKQFQFDEFNSGDENAGNSDGSAGKLWLNDEVRSPMVRFNPQLETYYYSTGRSYPITDPIAATDGTELHDMERLYGEPTSNELFFNQLTEIPVVTTDSLRKSLRERQPKSCVMKRTAPSVRRSRSSSRAYRCKVQRLVMPLNGFGKSTGDVAPSLMHDESKRRNIQARKSLGLSDCHDFDLPFCSAAFVSNGSREDSSSEIVATNTDTFSLNEGSTLESSCKLEHSKIVVECLDKEFELREMLDLRSREVVIKKKRKPNRKSNNNDPAAFTARSEEQATLDIGASKTAISPDALEKSNESCHKVDGDEHLPLLKRARVRMGNSSTEVGELDNFIHEEIKSSKETLDYHSEFFSASQIFDDHAASDRTSLEVKVVANSSPLSNICNYAIEKGSQFWKVKKYQLHGSSVDGEAVLPPSKRLHRALEAMSANVAEDCQVHTEALGATSDNMAENGQVSTEAPSTIGLPSNGCTARSEMKTPSIITMDRKEGNTLEAENVNCIGDDISLASTSLDPHAPVVATKTTSGMESCDHVGSSIVPEGNSKSRLTDTRNCSDTKGPSHSFIDNSTSGTEISIKSPQSFSSNFIRNHSSLGSNQDSLNKCSPSTYEGKIEILQSIRQSCANVVKEVGTSFEVEGLDNLCTATDPDSVSNSEEAANSHHKAIKVVLSIVEGNSCEDTNLLKPQRNKNGKVKGMFEIVEEPTQNSTKKNIDSPSYPTSMKVLIADAHAKQGSASMLTSISYSKGVSCSPPSPWPTDRIDSSEQVSPSNPSMSDITLLDNGSSLQTSGNNYLAVLSPQKKTMNAVDVYGGVHYEAAVTHGRNRTCETEANAARKSFGAMLGTLSRTKESIGRATRIAINCAKLGLAGEVVETLVQNLENESSLHRRVDLFFLVDSITQCSRSQKGDVGDIYPSAVQAVLPRLLSAVAPPGTMAQENRRQCLKVLRLWLERKILPEFIVRYHMQELGSFNDSSTGSLPQCSPRAERALNDPVREMEGMLLDEYGSNASFQLPGFRMPRLLGDEEEGSDFDEKSFEAVTPEHDPEIREKWELIHAVEKHPHILEDVDGELEMEDVAPPHEAELNSTCDAGGADNEHTLLCCPEQHLLLTFAPPLPEDIPPSPPPLPTSPPPVAPPSLSLHPPPSAMPHPSANGVSSDFHMASQNMQNHLPQSVIHQTRASCVDLRNSATIRYCAPEYRDPTMQMQMQRPGSASYSLARSFPASHQSTQLRNVIQPADGANLHNNPYHLQCPPPSVTNQFSYAPAYQRAQSWKETSSSYPNRSHFVHNMIWGNSKGDQDRTKMAQHKLDENFRFCAPYSAGLVHSDIAKRTYATVPDFGSKCEPTRVASSGGTFLPRAWDFRNSVRSIRPPFEGPNVWIPR